MLFFTINLQFGTLNLISAYKKLNEIPINSIYLVFSSLEMQRRFIQTNVYYKIISCLKRKNSQTFKSSSSKNFFSSVLAQLTSMNVTYFDNLKTFFFIKFHYYTEVFFNRHLVAFVEEIFFKEIRM